MEYRIDKDTLCVYEGRISYSDFIKGEKVFQGESLMECYAWIKIKQEGLFLI
jgi:hypothetical protein